MALAAFPRGAFLLRTRTVCVDSGDRAGLHRRRDLRAARTARGRRALLRAARVLFLYRVLSRLGRDFVLRQSLLRLADSDFHHWLERFLRSRRAILRLATCGIAD